MESPPPGNESNFERNHYLAGPRWTDQRAMVCLRSTLNDGTTRSRRAEKRQIAGQKTNPLSSAESAVTDLGMSGVRVVGRHAERRVHPDLGWQAQRMGGRTGRILRAGRFITSKVRRLIRTGSMLRRRAVGLGKSFSAPMMAAKRGIQPGSRPANRLTTPDGMPKGESNKFVYEGEAGKPLHHSGTTARSIRGNSNASGISSRR